VAARAEIDWGKVRAEAFERFGVRRFRRGQRELLDAALSGRDAVGILPTGAGKSLTFQLPAVLLPGTVIVASPLIALMQDQTDKLADAEVGAARLDSTLHAGEARAEEAAIQRGRRDVVYVAPERLANEEALAALRRQEISLFVVDEAHCVSQWGHDFRPAYLALADAARALGRPPILALTATSPPQVTEDIVRQLGLLDPVVVDTGIERDNLFLEVRECPDAADKEAALLAALRETDGAAIVYCATIRAAAEVHERVARAGIAAELYHGKRRTADREEAQRRFMAGEARVMVATSAFGMGIDRPDIRLVAHWNFPDSVETYYQEAGRAGRDGAPARALLLYRPEDRRIQSFFMGGRYPPREELRATWVALERAGTHPTPVKKIAADAGLTDRHAQVALSLLRTLGVAERRGAGFRKTRDFASAEEWDAFLSSYERRAELDRDRLRAIVRYAQTALCRMQALRVYFGEGAGRPCGHCDNCRDRPQVAAEVLRAEQEAAGRAGLGAPAAG
jgi:ATP-dependent DNA helicase RecQ